MPENMIHKSLDFEVRQVGPPENRTLEFIGSTGHVDRYGDIIEPSGWDIKNYQKNPVFLWAHDYREPPVGRAVKVKKTADALIFHIQFADAETYAFADTVYRLYLGGFLKATSVGFQDLEREPIIDKKNDGKQTGWRFIRQELYELSAVPVPANPYALIQDAVKKGVIPAEQARAFQDQETRGAIPFKEYPTDPEGAPWDGPAERKAADINDLKIISAWVNSAKPDAKGSYKLLHHRAEGYNVVWRGVSAAMSRLMQSATQVPDGDRKAVYTHLAKHYAQFEKTPPDFKGVDEYNKNEIKAIELGIDPTDGLIERLLTTVGLLQLRVSELERPDAVTVAPERLKEAIKSALEDLAAAKGIEITDYIALALNPGYEPEGGRQAEAPLDLSGIIAKTEKMHASVKA